jgi:hypothetical protein
MEPEFPSEKYAFLPGPRPLKFAYLPLVFYHRK